LAPRRTSEDDGTAVQDPRGGSERPLVPEVDWASFDRKSDEEIAAQVAENGGREATALS
jgi:hypothetical protein